MRSIKFNTEHVEGEAKKVGEVVIGNETIPVYEFSVNVVEQKKDVVLDYDGFSDNDSHGTSEYEREFLDIAQKLQDEIEKHNPIAFAFIDSDINRYFFRNVDCASDNPVKGFIQAWTQFGEQWLTWTQVPAVADKIEKEEAFQSSFEKWALVKFLQLVFGDDFLPTPPPRYGSESANFGNGSFEVGKIGAWYFYAGSDMQVLDHNLPNYNCEFGFPDIIGSQLSEEELELLYEVLIRIRPPKDFYKNIE